MFTYVSLLSLRHMCTLGGQNRLLDSLELELQVIECEPPDVHAGLQIQALGKSRKCSQSLSHFSSPSLKYL